MLVRPNKQSCIDQLKFVIITDYYLPVTTGQANNKKNDFPPGDFVFLPILSDKNNAGTDPFHPRREGVGQFINVANKGCYVT